MSMRVIRATVRLEWQRSWSLASKLLIGIAVGGVLAASGSPAAAVGGALVAMVLGLVMILLGPLRAGTERLTHRVAAWRTVPQPRLLIASARSVAAASQAAVVGVALVPLALAAGGVPGGPDHIAGPGGMALLLAAASMVAGGLAALVTGLASRFPLGRLVVISFYLMLADSMLLNDRLQTAIEGSLKGLGLRLVEITAAGGGAILLGIGVVVLLVGTIAGALLIAWAVATAEERDAPTSRFRALQRDWFRLRYPAGQRHPVFAVAALQARLALERTPGLLALLVAGIVLRPVLPGSIAELVRIYLPIFAVMIPAGVLSRTMQGRMMGHLEGVATLPVRRETVVLGTLLALGILATIAVTCLAVIHAQDGDIIPLTGLFGRWGLLTGGLAIGTGMAAWFKPRHLAIILPLAIVLVFTVAIVAGAALLRIDIGEAGSLGPLLPLVGGLAGLAILVPIGGVIYARGLQRFEVVRR